MKGAVIWLTAGNVAEVKIMLASIVAALVLYQVLLIAVGYGKLRVPFLKSGAASRSHRALGDGIVVLTIVTAIMCISYFEVEDENVVHAALGTALLVLLAVKIAAVRRWIRADRLLPWLGVSVLLLFLATWLSSAAPYLMK